MKKEYLLVVLLVMTTVLVACSATIEEEKEKTLEDVEQIFEEEPNRPNEHIEELSFRLPFRTSIVEESDNNVIIEKSNDTFVLFYHQNEEAGNDVVYTMTTKDTENPWMVNETFEDGDSIGYVLMRQENEEEYELVTGIDDVKLTTISSLEDLSKNASWMMETVKSVEWNNESE
ncbi:hypothetical protein [Jeotgalibacillus marinus]|uniref:DUF4367 domain-containing protein n=1 Tax=Jeotgalibacillus marinus TaxID=86667 RepID=A0ABV3Q190_9BACL